MILTSNACCKGIGRKKISERSKFQFRHQLSNFEFGNTVYCRLVYTPISINQNPCFSGTTQSIKTWNIQLSADQMARLPFLGVK